VVVLGKAELSPSAVIDGSFVVVGGSATAAAGRGSTETSSS
jgi:hypothetical protein